MRILVTGGAGYIGSVVTEELLADGHEVTVYDNLSNGHRAAVHPEARFVEGDLADGVLLRRTFREQRTEAVVHMAAYAYVGESMTNPSKYYRNNLVNGVELLDAMRDREVRKIVFSSTCATYGEPARVPMDEELPQTPLNPYGQAKLAFEGALKWYGLAYGMNYASLRYFNAAGASRRFGEHHDPETHVIPIVLQAAAGTRTHVEIYGDDYPTRDGTCIRDYIHVIDLAGANVLALGIRD
jgi:UDP-glucose 4-epimerase